MDRRNQTFENKCYRRMFGILYREHKTNEYVWQQVSIFAGRQELLLSSYHGSAMSVVMMRCRRSYYKELRNVVFVEDDLVNHGRITSRNGHASRCRHCCASRLTEVSGQSPERMQRRVTGISWFGGIYTVKAF